MLPLPLSHLLQPNLLDLGRLPARSNLEAFPDRTVLATGGSPWRCALDGVWRFQLVPAPDRAPRDWTVADTGAAGWRDINVPGVWTRQGTGDLPHYANWRMPFETAGPPEMPADNPTGLYRTRFEVSDAWDARQTVLHIGGFESLVLVWCNGRFVGMGKDSRLPSEFDLTEHVNEGGNNLAIMVVRWCDATWIEDQDHWNHGGLHRSVFLESRAATHVRDIIVDTDFEAKTQIGTATIKVETSGLSTGYRARAVLEDRAGQVCFTSADTPIDQFDIAQAVGAQWAQSYAFKGPVSVIELELSGATPWSAERPSRYRLITELIDADGAVCEVHETWIGFTRVETRDRRLLVNGKPVVLVGVNRHDHHPENGKTCSKEDIRAELVTMKRHNINAIRTAHYPNDPVLLDLADELGFYVIDEANVECHARWSEVAQHPGYRAAIVDRTVRMIARDRNHPSIIGWSLGNEAGHGPAHDAAAAAARHLDPGRFVHYEGAVSLRLSFPFGRSPETTQQAPTNAERAATDVVCPMYPPIDHIVDWARWAEQTQLDDRPLLLCEFSHAMGNSNGSLGDYVDAFFAEPALAGGFVWDWRDQGLAETDAEGRFFWAYGGHYGDEPNDANFNINGLVGPDGAPHPALREYMWAARPLAVEMAGPGRIRVHNRRVFENSSDVTLVWCVLCDGEEVERGQLNPDIRAGEVAEIVLEIQTDIEGGEWHLNVSWVLNAATDWAPEGHVVAWDQLVLSAPTSAPMRVPSLAGAAAESDENFTLTTGRAALNVDSDGAITGLAVSGAAVIVSPITPSLWRPPTDNDGGKPGARPLFQNRTAEWVGYGLNALVPGRVERSTHSAADEEVTKLRRAWTGANDAALIHETRLHRVEDALIFDEEIVVPEAWLDLPRVGLRFEVAPEFDQLEWFGLGPDESYPDRKGAQTVGLWRSSVADQYHPYVRPQEYGAHEDVRWFRLRNDKGQGVQVTLPQPLSFTARLHHTEDLNAAETLAELTERGTIEVLIDAAMRGLGTAACGPDALPQYRVGAGTYRFRWQLQYLDGA